MGHSWALWVLVGINLVNYLDRQILYALLPLIQAELKVTDAQLGGLASAFMLVYMCAAPPIGYWADRYSRRLWISAGVAVWSLATFLSGAAATYRQLFCARAAVGIGESCYGTISPSFLAEQFPASSRARVLSIFSLAIPVGSALGYILGGSIGEHWGWRQAFFVVGVPGLILAVLAYRLQDPRENPQSRSPKRIPTRGDYMDLSRNPSYISCTLGMAAMTFGLGAFAVWMPTFFHRVWGMNVAQAGTLFGTLTVVSGLSGSLLGGWLADRALRVTPGAYFLVSGLGLLACVPLGWLALSTSHYPTSVAALFLAEFSAFLNMGPLNALIVSVTSPHIRSMAFAVNIFVIHLLGDAASPAIIGILSDRIGLRSGLLCATTMLGVAGLLCLCGMRYVPRDSQRAQAYA